MQGRQDWLTLSRSTEVLGGRATAGAGEGASKAEGLRRLSPDKLKVQSKN